MALSASALPDARNGEVSVPVDPAIEETLQRWAAAFASNDIAAEITFYGPVVSPYFHVHDVKRETIESDKRNLFDKGVRLVNYSIRSLNITMVSRDEAVALLTKDWQTREGAEYSRSTRSRLHLKRFDSEWKIVGEQDLGSAR